MLVYTRYNEALSIFDEEDSEDDSRSHVSDACDMLFDVKRQTSSWGQLWRT